MADETPVEPVSQVPKVGYRCCEACGVPKELKHFPLADKSGERHREYVCKICRTKIRQKQKLEKMETRACHAFIEKARSGGSDVPHISEMLESVVRLFGGADGFAGALVSQFYAAPPGGRLRTQILESIVRLTAKVADSGATRAPAALMSDEDLEQEIEKRMQTAVLQFKGQKFIEAPRVEKDVELPDVAKGRETA